MTWYQDPEGNLYLTVRQGYYKFDLTTGSFKKCRKSLGNTFEVHSAPTGVIEDVADYATDIKLVSSEEALGEIVWNAPTRPGEL